jgi:predicted dehydrogenase
MSPTSERINLALIGNGYWGSKLLRVASALPQCRLRVVCDPDPAKLEEVGHHLDLSTTTSFEEVVARDDVDALLLASPAGLHAAQAELALRAGKHVFVEKPLALTVEDCRRVCETAAECERTLMVGHTFVYSEPVRELRRRIAAEELGRVLYIYAQRLNLGAFRDDMGAMWDLAPHDVSILLYLLGERPLRVAAREFSLLGDDLGDVSFMMLEFPGGVVAHLHDSRLDPRKVRQLTVVGDRKMAVYDDTDVEAPIRIYDRGADRQRTEELLKQQGFGEFKFEVRSGDVLLPKITALEPLRTEIEHFVDCIRTGREPDSPGWQGEAVASVLNAAELSAKQGGAVIGLDAG